MTAARREPIGRARPWARLARHALVVVARVRRRLGVRRGLKVDGVYYKELTSQSLPRALSAGGEGHKDYRVTFPDRTKLVIRCARDQVYADLMGPLEIERLEALLPVVRPGARLLEFDSGTGFRAYWLSFVVGPSGGVAAISNRPDHAAYAAKRYPRPNIGFETAEGFALAGETDGAFDAVVALALPGDEAQRRTLLSELWRLTAPGGAMLTGVESDETGALAEAVRELAEQDGAELQFLETGTVKDALVMRRPEAAGRAGPGRAGGRGRPPQK